MTTEASAAGPSIVYYYYDRDRIVVTSRYIENPHGFYRIRDLRLIERVEVYSHPARSVALICGAIEMALGAVLAVTIGAAILVLAGFICAAGIVTGILIDGRRNPTWMALRAVHRQKQVTLFTSRNQQEFGQVRRAVIRATEQNGPPR